MIHLRTPAREALAAWPLNASTDAAAVGAVAPLPALAESFALFGAAPALARPLPVGQLYWPSWERYEAAMRELCAEGPRPAGAVDGPRVRRLEALLAERMRVPHVICVSNATIGLIMACEALGLTGKVVLPSFTFIATPQSLSWSGLTPVFCDVDPVSHQITPALVEPLLTPEVSAILAVNLWGDACPAAPLQALADRHGVPLFFDSAHSMGCEIDGVPVGNFGALEVFSFHATKAFSSAEGGCITTRDAALARRLRRIRDGSEAGAAQPRRTRGAHARMSEAQAAIGLLNLEDFDGTLARNRAIHACYREALGAIPGVDLHEARHASRTNHQYVVCEIDEAAFGLSRDVLLGLLKAENVVARRYFYPGSHRSVPYAESLPEFLDALPNTDRLNARLLQLPTGALVGDADVATICGVIVQAQRRAAEIRAQISAF